jgi:predicted small metal-binding protein
MHKIKTHTNETHGTSDDIKEDTTLDKVKGPNVKKGRNNK